ncbi:MAG: methionyl-tRNA formyltransferase [Candidatus Omnitrophota bacterium]|nr:MAG: methionyl-tRNA formyltransferase [Candidatus Omnitrophota bacterium]
MKKVVIATIKSWNIRNAYKFKELYKDKYEVVIITDKRELSEKNIRSINPEWIFFPHWSWIIPPELYEKYTCVVFHITDLPFGRGGSPLQNLIQRKIYHTKISAIQVEEGIDTGKIYLKKDFYIGIGSAEEIFIAASQIIFFDMIPYILENKPIPQAQEGELIVFKRRRPEESNLQKAEIKNLDDFYDFVRMLDAEGYPKAFFKINNLKIEFSEVHKKSNKLVGRFEVFYEEN